MRRILAATLLLLVAGLHAATPAGATGSEGIQIERIPIGGDVVHYRFRLPVGPGEHDVVRLHRIVRERAPWIPAPARRGVFLVHGDAWGFEPAYLSSVATPAVPDTQNVAVFLAERGLDVWGLDFRWALVPQETADLSFMADWGLGTSVADLDRALTAARAVRAVTGSGASRLYLLGWSRGGQIGWIQLGAESQRPPALRQVRAFVAMDHTFKTDDEAIRQASCAAHASIQAQIDGGAVASDFSFAAVVGDLATTAPDAPSPFLPSLGNADLAEWLGADPAGGAIPHLHSVGGIVDPDTLVTELLYTAPAHWFSYLSGVSPYQPIRIALDGEAILCDETDTPFDDHLAAIRVPVLYVGAAGSYGAAGVHTTTLIGSHDVTTLLVSQASDPRLDWGHNDLFLADDAAAEVWQPILDWLLAH